MTENEILNNRYQLMNPIGRGSFGEVWMANDLRLDITVAVKVYAALDGKGITEFRDEFKNVYKLHHPNLLRPDYFDTVGDNPYLVMPYCPRSADDLVGGITEHELWRFIRDVASGLAYLHENDVIHRDIKPENILQDEQGDYVISDFGLSTKMRSTLRQASMRQNDGFSGTIAYMAPELFTSKPTAVKATDVWALGVTIYEMATGELPFCGQGGCMLNAGAEIPELDSTKWSSRLNEVMRRCLAKDTWDRPTAKDLAEYSNLIMNGDKRRWSQWKGADNPKPEHKTRMSHFSIVGMVLASLFTVVSCLFIFELLFNNKNATSVNSEHAESIEWNNDSIAIPSYDDSSIDDRTNDVDMSTDESILKNKSLSNAKDSKDSYGVTNQHDKERDKLPEVRTGLLSGITSTSALCGGWNDGLGTVTNRGVVWGTSPNPTVALSTKTEEEAHNKEFTSIISGLKPATKYYIRAYATNSSGTTYGEEVSFITHPCDLSFSGSANCYIIFQEGGYMFKTVKGNSSLSIDDIESASVLWESFGTSTPPANGDLIKSVSYNDGYILFETSSIFKKGNAVIAAKDVGGNILWSWHIWLTDEPKGQVYYNGAGTMMDRNLGATSIIPGDVTTCGLLYQWGRKDPFIGSSSINSNVVAMSTLAWPSSVKSTSVTGTIAYAIAHPTTFISSNDNNHDWLFSSNSKTDNTRWRTSKTIYDPCPSGWRIPDGDDNGVWAKAFGTSDIFEHNRDKANNGMNFSMKLGSSPSIWYPASGSLMEESGSLKTVGVEGSWWSISHNSGNYAYYMYFSGFDNVCAALAFGRATGRSIRCLKE